MKVAVLIMSANKEPSLRNIEAMRETFIKQVEDGSFKNDYDFFEYYFDENLEIEKVEVIQKSKNFYSIRIGGYETVYRTYEKTYFAFKHLIESDSFPEYEKFIRINISSYLNMNLLDSVIESAEDNKIYAAALNTYINGEVPELANHLYARGDFYIMSRKTVKGILDYGKDILYNDIADKNRLMINHVDDTLMGYAYIQYMGLKHYFDNLNMVYYGFIPNPTENLDEISNNINKNALTTRVKTVPPTVAYSGYSWDDNEYRLYDVKKIKIIHEILKNCKYTTKSINDLIVPIKEERSTTVVNLLPAKPSEIKKYLRQVIK